MDIFILKMAHSALRTIISTLRVTKRHSEPRAFKRFDGTHRGVSTEGESEYENAHWRMFLDFPPVTLIECVR